MIPTDAILIHESNNSLIYIDQGKQQPVLVKMLKAENPSPQRILQFYNEYEFTHSLDIESVRKALDKKKSGGRYFLYLEYVDGKTLKEAFDAPGRTLEEKILAAIALAKAIGELHQNGIIHKDITSRNVLINSDFSQVKLIDFGLSTKIDLKTTQLENPDRLEGTLAYLSPEQTGRMNRVIDYRTDLYSTGVVLYELFTGRMPFVSEDAMEMVHMHIALSPIPPSEVDQAIPEQISRIILQLLSKNAEDRYQSAYALQKDFESCLQMLKKSGRIDPFNLSDQDIVGSFRIPQKLYGRELELDQLMSAFRRVSKGKTESVLISGYSGVGKSALVNEIHKPVTSSRGYFIKGKFDQYQRNVPYFAITQAFNEFCSYILTEKQDKLSYFTQHIKQAVGELGGVLTEIIPKLEKIIGKQAPVEKLEPEENKARLQTYFLKFIQAICGPDHPVVLFIDDLQWIDQASTNLLKLLMSDEENAFLLIIGAYRDNEVDAYHRLMVMLEELSHEGTEGRYPYTEIKLKPLTREMTGLLVADTFPGNDHLQDDLTSILFEKTRGNAFFLKEFLKTLADKKLITYQYDTGKWQLERERVLEQDISDNVVDLMTAKLLELPQDSLEILKLASCIGNRFNLKALSVISGINIFETFSSLWTTIEEGLLVPENEDYKLLQIEEDTQYTDQNIYFHFLHDRVQQATYSLLSEDQKQETHLKIGRLLREEASMEDELFFDVVNHMNLGRNLVSDKSEILEIIKLNVRAAKKAKESTAYTSAGNYLEIANSLMNEEHWETEYALTLDTLKLLAETHYLNGKFEEFDEMINTCLSNAKTALERAEIYYLLILRHTMTSEHQKSIEFARKGLEEVGFTFPANAEEAGALIEPYMGKLLGYFGKHGIEPLFEHVEMEDPLHLATMKLLDNISMPSYVSGSLNIWIIHALMKVQYSIEHGNCPETAYAFSELGLIFCIQGLFDFGLPSGELSRKLANKYQSRSLRHKSRSFHLIANYIHPWYKHIRETDQLINEGFQVSVDAGEIIFAGYLRYHQLYNYFYEGELTLRDLRQKLPAAIQYCRRIKHDLGYDSLLALEMFLDNLEGKTSGTTDISSASYDETTYLKLCEDKLDYYSMAVYFSYKASILYLRHAYPEALEALGRAKEIVNPLRGNTVHFTRFIMYENLILSANYPAASKDDQQTFLETMEQNLELMTSFASAGPANCLHRQFLMEAEIHRLKGEDTKALEAYHQAIQNASEEGFKQNEAIAHELIASYWTSKNQGIYVGAHLKQAEANYLAWGATAVSDQLKRAKPEYFTTSVQDRTPGYQSNIGSGSSSAKELDLMSIFKASQTLSGEIDLNKLLHTLLKVVIENAGAQRVLLFLEQNNNWHLTALGTIDGTYQVLDFEEAQSETAYPASVINYVIRTGEQILLTDLTDNHLFIKDPYFNEANPQSVWALPMRTKGKLSGLMYLENSIASDAFTRDRQEVLLMLLGQITISIENARLYSHLKDLNLAYQKFVPTEFLNHLGYNSILDVHLGDQTENEQTVLFLDIRSYTKLSETMSPEENFNFINGFLSRVFPSIERHGGVVNQLYGDGIMALYPDSTSGLNSALDIQKSMVNYNHYRVQKERVPIRVGIGMHTGKLMLGIIGDKRRLNTGVISKVVNTASRIEGLTKIFGASVLLSENCLQKIDPSLDYNYRFLGKVQVLGTQDPIKVYEFFDGEEQSIVERRKQTVKAFNDALNYYFEKDFVMAASCLKEVLSIDPNDVIANRYFRHTAEYMISGVPEGWSGIEKMETK